MCQKICENCKYAILSGGDYAPGFGGCYTPEIVEECSCPSLADIDDLEEILLKGESGKCECWEEA